MKRSKDMRNWNDDVLQKNEQGNVFSFFFYHLFHLGEGLPQLAYNQAETPENTGLWLSAKPISKGINKNRN
jgi:hypothetical protein